MIERETNAPNISPRMKLEDDFTEVAGIAMFLLDVAQGAMDGEDVPPHWFTTGFNCCRRYLDTRLVTHAEMIDELDHEVNHARK